jgi:hypothetical protein
MIEAFTKAWFANLHTMREKFAAKHPESYMDVVRVVVEMLNASTDDYDRIDPARIHEIDDGCYQGTLVYIIGGSGYQPNRYWYVKVGYGSCSGCDTLESIRAYGDDAPNETQVSEYMTLALHIIQGLREMGGESV